MTTLVAEADVKVPARSEHVRVNIGTTVDAVVLPSGSEHQVDCPACGLPATIEWRDMVAGTSGPVVHMKLRCPLGRHSYLMLEEGL
jgi:hypothetical protein